MDDTTTSQQVKNMTRQRGLPKDPPMFDQKWALFSFKLLPNPVDGVYGFLKFRGAFPTEKEYTEKCAELLQVDPHHIIWPYPQGEWFPLTNNPKFAKDVYEISDNPEELKTIFNQQDTAEKKLQKQRVMDAKKRASYLQEAVNEEADPDTLIHFARKRMEVEQINSWLETTRHRKRDLTNALRKTRDEIKRIEETHPEFLDQVEDKIKEIRGEIGLEM